MRTRLPTSCLRKGAFYFSSIEIVYSLIRLTYDKIVSALLWVTVLPLCDSSAIICDLIAIVALERPVNGNNSSSGSKRLSQRLDKGLEQIKHRGPGSQG